MTAVSRRAALLFVLVIASLLPATAAARSDYVVHPGRFDLSVDLPDHDGFSYSIEAAGHHRIELVAFKGSTSVTYEVEGSAGAHGVHANFGSLGRVDLQIAVDPKESPLSLPEPENCTGRGPTLLSGSIHGTASFEGEPGVAGMTAHRGGVTILRDFKSVCRKQHRRHHRRGDEKGESEKIEGLIAQAHSEGRTTKFAALSLELQAKPPVVFSLVAASQTERRGQVEVSRRALEFAKELFKSGTGPTRPRTTTLTPPQPFLGSATLSQAPGSAPTWEGDLGVRLLGAGLVPLAGPGFSARLCQGRSLDAFDACFQGSGSHSQPLALARLSSLRYLRNSSSSAGSTLYTWSGSGKWRLRTSAP